MVKDRVMVMVHRRLVKVSKKQVRMILMFRLMIMKMKKVVVMMKVTPI